MALRWTRTSHRDFIIDITTYFITTFIHSIFESSQGVKTCHEMGHIDVTVTHFPRHMTAIWTIRIAFGSQFGFPVWSHSGHSDFKKRIYFYKVKKYSGKNNGFRMSKKRCWCFNCSNYNTQNCEDLSVSNYVYFKCARTASACTEKKLRRVTIQNLAFGKQMKYEKNISCNLDLLTRI